MRSNSVDPKRLPGRRLQVATLAAALLLAACAETSLNEAPIVDRSKPSRATLPIVPLAEEGNAGSAARDAAAGIYVVQKGDTLFHIAGNFHVSLRDLARWNELDEKAPIFIGQRLRIRPPATPSADAQWYSPVTPDSPVAPASTADAEAETKPIAIGASGGVETRARAAVPGLAPAVDAMTAPAGTVSGAGNAPGMVSAAPLGTADAAAATAAAASGAIVADQVPHAPPAAPAPVAVEPPKTSAAMAWIWPVDGRVISKFDAQRSKGIEIAATEDAQVIAAADGEVSYTGSPRDYGNLVILRHPDGLLSVYAHNKSILVQQGQTVTRGQAIAVAGKTSGSTPSVHFEVRRKGVPIDPLELLPPR
jgi:lipoprotein NlpD